METMIRLYLALVGILARAAATLAPQPQLAVARARRGAGFLEYMMVAALAVAAFVALKLIFPSVLSGLLDNIKNAINI